MTFSSKVLQSFVVQLVILLCALVSSVIVTRYLGPVGRGEMAILQNLVVMSTAFGNFGIHAATMYYGAKADQAAAQVICSTGLTIALVAGSGLMLIAMVLYFLVPASFEGTSFMMVVITSLQIVPTLAIYILQHFLVARDKIREVNAFLLIYALANVLLPVVLFLGLQGDLRSYMISQVVIVALLTAVLAVIVRHRAGVRVVPGGDVEWGRRLLAYGSASFVAGLLGIVVLRSNLFFINAYVGTAATGNFSIAGRFGDIVSILPGQIGLLLMPRISADNSTVSATPRISRLLVILLGMLSIGGALLAKPVIVLLFGDRFLDAVEPTRIMIAAYAILGIESVYANHVLGIGHPKKLVLLWIPPFILSFVLNVALIPSLGLVGAALSMLATNALLFVLVLLFVARKMHVPVRDFLIVRSGDVQAWLGVLRTLRSPVRGGTLTIGASDDH